MNSLKHKLNINVKQIAGKLERRPGLILLFVVGIIALSVGLSLTPMFLGNTNATNILTVKSAVPKIIESLREQTMTRINGRNKALPVLDYTLDPF